MKMPYFVLVFAGLSPLAVHSQTSPSSSAPICMEGMAMPGCRAKEPATVEVPMPMRPAQDTHSLQEPEQPAHRSGTLDSSVPDLLKDIATRKPMGLEEFLSLAERTNPTLAQANAVVRRAEQQARQAGLYPNPSIEYQGEQIRGGSYGGGEQGGYVQQTIVLGGKLGLRREIYNQQKSADQTGVEEQRYRIRGAVTQAFYTALTAQAMVTMRRQLLGVALDAVDTVHQLANVGQADAPDVLQAEVEAEQAKIEYVTSQRTYLQSFRVLAANAGDAGLSVAPLKGTLENPPQIDPQRMIASMMEESPVVKRMQKEALVAEARLQAARREAVPDLTLRVGEQYNGERITGGHPQAVGAQSFASAEIGLPLWNRNQGNVGAAKAEVERSRLEVSRTQLALSAEAGTLAEAYLSSQFQAARYKTELIPRAHRAYELYLAKYQKMASAYPQVLVSQRTVFQLQVSYLQALHEVWRNATALQNFTLSGGLGSLGASESSSGGIQSDAGGER